MSIWIMSWTTESSDSGIAGYWTRKPTKKYLSKYIADRFPDDHEAGTFYYEIIELKPIEGYNT